MFFAPLLLLTYGVFSALAQNLTTSSMTTLSLTLTVETDVPVATGLSNGLALTPPMGFSSWNQFGDQITEQLFRDTIDTST